MRIFHFSLLVFLSACSLVPDFVKPPAPQPTGWRNGETLAGAQISADWWENFHSGTLNAMVTQARANNTDIGAGLARVDQARANARIAGAPLLPSIGADGTLARDYTGPPNTQRTSVTSYRTGVNLSYALDLFGRNRANANAAEFSAAATQYDFDALTLVVSGDTATAYIDLIAFDERIQVAKENLGNAQDLLRIIEARYQAGTVSAFERAQQQTDVASNAAALAGLQRQREQQWNSLAVLTGKAPQELTAPQEKLEALSLPVVAAALPTELLTRRPDIARAEADLKAADFNISAARAAFFPSVTLGGNAGLSASPSSAPATDVLGALVSVDLPLFTGGALQGELERAKARRRELAENYRAAVLTAFRETEDALALIAASDQRLDQFNAAAKAAAEAYRLSRLRYDAGIIDFQALLDAQRSLFNAQEAAITARADRLAAAVALYQALGGGWQDRAAQNSA